MGQRNIGVSDTNVKVTFKILTLDGLPALGEAGNQPQISVNSGSFDDTGIGVLVAVGYGEYYALLSDDTLRVEGDVYKTRYKSGITQESEGDSFLVGTITQVISITHYGTVVDGDTYFNSSLWGRKWKNSSPSRKQQALVSATQIVDRYNYCGCKANDGQVLQFPRKNSYTDPITGDVTTTSDDNVPNDIAVATYLIADKLLDGWDPDMEADNLNTIQNKYDKVAVLSTREFIPEHLRAGVPSARAWGILRQYIRDPQSLVLVRM
jgi:hypothetical protein